MLNIKGKKIKKSEVVPSSVPYFQSTIKRRGRHPYILSYSSTS